MFFSVHLFYIYNTSFIPTFKNHWNLKLNCTWTELNCNLMSQRWVIRIIHPFEAAIDVFFFSFGSVSQWSIKASIFLNENSLKPNVQKVKSKIHLARCNPPFYSFTILMELQFNKWKKYPISGSYLTKNWLFQESHGKRNSSPAK